MGRARDVSTFGPSLVAVVGLALLLLSGVSTASSQTVDGAGDTSASRETPAQTASEAEEMALRVGRALSRRLTVWTRASGRATYSIHCRRAPEGCLARIATIARYMAEVSYEQRLDPFVLAAMAMRESGMNPFAEGPAGERGIVQLHPRGVGGHVRFVNNERYRERCRRQVGACQEEVLEVGALHLRQAIDHCGDLASGLGRYNSGRCGETAYTRRVMRERERLLDLIKTSDDQSDRTVARAVD